MPVPNSRNARIAIAKGWTFDAGIIYHVPVEGTSWRNPQDEPALLPDYVGTLAGVAMLRRELGEAWCLGRDIERWLCYRGENCGPEEFFWSPDDRPGDCVGDAWLSVFGQKEGNDAN